MNTNNYDGRWRDADAFLEGRLMRSVGIATSGSSSSASSSSPASQRILCGRSLLRLYERNQIQRVGP